MMEVFYAVAVVENCLVYGTSRILPSIWYKLRTIWYFVQIVNCLVCLFSNTSMRNISKITKVYNLPAVS